MREQNRGIKKQMKGQSTDGRKNTRTNELTNGRESRTEEQRRE